MISPPRISVWTYFLVLLALCFRFAENGNCAPKTSPVIVAVSVTNYVGTEYRDDATPEYMARTVLRADGTALYFGNPTYAPRKGQFKGNFAPSYFAKFQKAFSGAFAKPQHLQKYSVTSCTRTKFDILRADGARRSVTFYELQEIPTIQALINMTYGLTWKIKWQPYVGVNNYNRDLSGVRGFVMNGSRDGRISKALGAPSNAVLVGVPLSLQNAGGKEIAHGISDRAGAFCIVAPPGNYFLVPKFPAGTRPQPYAAKQPVTVNANGFSDVFVESMPNPKK